MVEWFHSKDLKEIPFLLVLVIEMAALAYAAAAPQHWLRAVGGMVAGMIVAGVFRLVLGNEQAGLLRVRNRTFDVACYWGFGVLAVTFAVALPQR
ncbi:MAG TPA: DUF3017 domain-containing protein [Jatrophihabitans sp.]|jgi:hypothetical protein